MTALDSTTSTAAAARLTYRSSKDKGRAIAELCRLQIARVPALVYVAAALSTEAPAIELAAGVLLIGACCAMAAALNDRADVETDRCNGRLDRPLVSGDVTGRDVTGVIAGSALVVLGTQTVLPQPAGVVVTLAAAAIAWGTACEPVALQRRGVAGLVALATGYLLLPIALAGGSTHVLDALPLVLLGAGVLAHKDVRDLVGDRAAGKRTLLVQVGEQRMCAIAALLASFGCAGLWATSGPGWWLVPATLTALALATMAARGHDVRLWTIARAGLIATALAVGYSGG